MNIEKEVRKYAKNEEHVADMQSLIQNLIDESVNAERHIGIVRKVVAGLEELQREDFRLNQQAAPPGDALVISDIHEWMEDCLSFAEHTRRKGDYRRYIAWRVAVIMYFHGIELMATKNGQYENLVEVVLKSLGEKTGGVHRIVLDVLPDIKLYTTSVTNYKNSDC